MSVVSPSWSTPPPAVRPRAEAFIDGAFAAAAAGATFADHGPRDGRLLADVAACGAEDVDRAVRAGPRARSTAGAGPVRARASAGASCCASPT